MNFILFMVYTKVVCMNAYVIILCNIFKVSIFYFTFICLLNKKRIVGLNQGLQQSSMIYIIIITLFTLHTICGFFRSSKIIFNHLLHFFGIQTKVANYSTPIYTTTTHSLTYHITTHTPHLSLYGTTHTHTHPHNYTPQ